ncbi:MAG: type II toxin-antitoxin system PemK/MazF family toxin [Thomasclavelia spiroformis]
MIKSDIKKGDIYYATLNPAIGSEQKGERPVVVLQNDCGNKYSPTVMFINKDNKKKNYQHIF